MESVTESGTAADLGAWSAAGSHEGFNRYLPGQLEASLTYLLRPSHFVRVLVVHADADVL